MIKYYSETDIINSMPLSLCFAQGGSEFAKVNGKLSLEQKERGGRRQLHRNSAFYLVYKYDKLTGYSSVL